MFRLRFPSPATVIACLALFVALGGTGYAALRSPSPAHSAAAAAKKKKHKPITTSTVNRLIRRYFEKHKSDLVGATGPQGAQGLAGAPGATGAPGAPATTLFLQVDARTDPPTPLRQSGVTNIDGPGETGTNGFNEITFNRDVSHCVAVASAGSKDGNFPGVNTAATSHLDTNLIGVQVADNAGTPTTGDFALAVFC